MNLKSAIYLPVAAFLLLLSGCIKEMGEHKPITKSDAVPAVVKNIQVINRKGKAILTYAVPEDPNLLYIKATYRIKTGPAEVKASYYNDSLVLDGFGDTLEHEVKVYSVSRSEVVSEPTIVKVKPLEAPIWDVFRSISVENAFGGYNLKATNAGKANIAILVLTKNVVNEFETDNSKSIFTNVDAIDSKVRGLDTVTTTVGFAVRDRWGNTTDTIYRQVQPLYETIFPKSKFREFYLPGDAPQVTNGAALRYAWDGQYGWPWTSFTDQGAGGQGPHTVTMDMGTLGKVSRVWYRPYQEWGGQFYYLTTLRRFEIWGSENPSLGGAYDASWKLLGTYEVKKPSGLPYGTDDANDQAIASAGLNFEVDLNAPKVRYIRIRCLENWAGGTAQNINELAVYGDPR